MKIQQNNTENKFSKKNSIKIKRYRLLFLERKYEMMVKIYSSIKHLYEQNNVIQKS